MRIEVTVLAADRVAVRVEENALLLSEGLLGLNGSMTGPGAAAGGARRASALAPLSSRGDGAAKLPELRRALQR